MVSIVYLFEFQLLGECHCWWTKESPRAHVAKFCGRFRFWEHQIFCVEFIEIVILLVHYTIPFGLTLFWHLWASLFNFLNYIVWQRITDEGSVPEMRIWSISLFKERGGGQKCSTSFWMRFRQAPLCRYLFKVIFDDIIVLLSGNIIEYICFWRFNSIIMTWNKWLVFTKSVIMGLNNISPWPCPLCIVHLPCVITLLHFSCEPLV